MVIISFLVLSASKSNCEVKVDYSQEVPAYSGGISGSFLVSHHALIHKDISSAAMFARAAYSGDPLDQTLVQDAFVSSLANGDLPTAFYLADKIHKLSYLYDLSRIALTALFLKERDYTQALSYTSSLNSSYQPIIKLLRAWIVAAAGNTDGALEIIDSSNHAGFRAIFDHNAAMISDLRGYAYEAKKRWTSSVSADPRNIRIKIGYARYLLRNGNNELAKELLNNLIAQYPRNPVISSEIDAINKGKYPDRFASDAIAGVGEVLFHFATIENFDDVYIRLSLLNLSSFLGVRDGAVAATRGDLLAETKNYDGAISAYSTIPLDAPLYSLSKEQISRLDEIIGRHNEAKRVIRELLFDKPNDYRGLVAFGDLCSSEGDWKQAIQVYSRVLSVIQTPIQSDWRIYFAKAVAEDRAGYWNDAERDLRKAIEINPSAMEALNYLAYGWTIRNTKLLEALALTKRVVSNEPKSGPFADSYGWALFKLGHYDEAEEALNNAVSLSPSSAEIIEHLGDLYWSIGRKREATFEWQKCMELELDDENKSRLMIKIHNSNVE